MWLSLEASGCLWLSFSNITLKLQTPQCSLISGCWIVNENTTTDDPKSNQHLQDLRAVRDLLSQPPNHEDIEDYALGSSSDNENTQHTMVGEGIPSVVCQ